MPTYVVTGVSRGLGFEFVRHLAGTEGNTVVGLARNKEATEKKVAEQLKDLPGKIHILTGDLESYDSLKAAAEETAKLTGGAIDYLVANAAIMVTGKKFFKQIGELGENPKELEDELKFFFNTNVVGNIHLFNLFLPLLLKGEAKKVILVSSGMSDLSFSTKLEIEVSPVYVISKAAANMAVAKFAAQYKKDGVLFISVCPGVIEPGDGLDMSTLTEAETAQAMGLFGKFAGLREDFKGPSPPLEAIQKVIKVWENASIEKGNSGEFIPSTGVPGQWV